MGAILELKRFLNLILRESQEVKGDAYWVTPNNKFIVTSPYLHRHTYGQPRLVHIKNVLDEPTAFGYTEKQLRDIFDKYDEDYGVEGQAREEIILDLINKGYARLRNYRTKQGEVWSMNVAEKTSDKRIAKILKKLISVGHNEYSSIVIDKPSGKKKVEFKSFIEEHLPESNEKKAKRIIARKEHEKEIRKELEKYGLREL